MHLLMTVPHMTGLLRVACHPLSHQENTADILRPPVPGCGQQMQLQKPNGVT